MEAVHLRTRPCLSARSTRSAGRARRKLGDDGAGAAFMILQHAIGRPALQRRGLALMLDAIPQGQANALDAAYLSDRIAVFEGGQQTFGTQFDWDANGLLSPAPDRAIRETLDERRASVGLPPMAETIAEMRADAAAEGERAPADLAQRRARIRSLGAPRRLARLTLAAPAATWRATEGGHDAVAVGGLLALVGLGRAVSAPAAISR